MSSPRHIPGFYFDTEKKKYFAIQKNHRVPAGSKYTTSDVTRRNQIKREIERKERRARGEVERRPIPPRTRSKILNSYLGSDLTRSTGDVQDAKSKDRIIQTYLNQFGSAPKNCDLEGNPAAIIDLHNGLPGGTCPGQSPKYKTDPLEIQSFVWDSWRKSLWFTAAGRCPVHFAPLHFTWRFRLHDEHLFRVRSSWRLPTYRGPFDARVYGFLSPRLQFNSWNAISSSLSITPRGALLSTVIASEDDDVQYRIIPGEDRQEIATGVEEAATDQYTVWCAAPNPFGYLNVTEHPERIAFGTNAGVVIDDIAVGSLKAGNVSLVAKSYSDVLSLEWMGANTIAAGLRNSGILLIDDRSGDSVVRLRHAGSVTQLARVDDTGTKLVACGFPSAISMYDLRMVKEAVHSDAMGFATALKKESHWRNVQGARCQLSKPLFSFDYNNQKELHLGFDICRSLGLLAAAQGDGSIRIYSLRTGRTLKDLFIADSPNANQNPVRCIKFVDDYDTGLRILASQGTAIYQFGVHGHDHMEDISLV